MRLPELARKVSKTPKELLDFLQLNGFKQYSGSNAKIDPEHVIFVLQYFTSKTFIQKDLQKDLQQEKKSNFAIKKEDLKELSITGTSKMPNQDIPAESDHIELIRAPKVKLKGVTIVGKIDLPKPPEKTQKAETEKTKKEISTQDSHYKSTYKKAAKFSKSKFLDHKKHPKSNKKLTYQDKLKLEERERERKKMEKIKQEKERKRHHYQKNIQAKIQSPPARKKAKINLSEAEQSIIPKPHSVYKNQFRRFWAWLNGAYDEY